LTKLELLNKNHKISIFEIAILFVGILLTYFGFKIVMSLYHYYGEVSWAMMTTIFVWLILLVMFILLSLGVDASRKQLQEITLLRQIVSESNIETKIFKEELKVLTNIYKSKKKNSKKK
jgi:hypothetical protein